MQIHQVSIRSINKNSFIRKSSHITKSINTNHAPMNGHGEISFAASEAIKSNVLAGDNIKSYRELEARALEDSIIDYAIDSEELYEQAKVDLELIKDKFYRRYLYHNDGYDISTIKVEKNVPESNNVYRDGVTIFEKNPDGSQDTYTISEGKLSGYTKGLRTDEDGVETFEKRFRVFKNGAFEYFEKKSVPNSMLDEVGRSYCEYLAVDYKQNLKIHMQNLAFSPDGNLISWNKCIKFIQDENGQNQIYDYSEYNSNQKGFVPGLKTDFRDGKLVAYNIDGNGIQFVEFKKS